MARQPLVAKRAEELLGSSVVATSPVAGGDIATATRLRLSSGQTALMKTLPHAPEGFCQAEEVMQEPSETKTFLTACI